MNSLYECLDLLTFITSRTYWRNSWNPLGHSRSVTEVLYLLTSDICIIYVSVTIALQTMLTCNIRMYNYDLSPYKISMLM